MQFINYFFASIMSFSGLLIGLLLVKMAPEEQKPLQKYFDLGRKILLSAVFAFLAFYYFSSWIYFIALAFPIAFLFLTESKIRDLPKKHAATYAILGALFYLSSKNANLFTIESSMILLYGLPAASLSYKKGKNQKIILYSAGYIIVASLLFLITTSHF